MTTGRINQVTIFPQRAEPPGAAERQPESLRVWVSPPRPCRVDPGVRLGRARAVLPTAPTVIPQDPCRCRHALGPGARPASCNIRIPGGGFQPPRHASRAVLGFGVPPMSCKNGSQRPTIYRLLRCTTGLPPRLQGSANDARWLSKIDVRS